MQKRKVNLQFLLKNTVRSVGNQINLNVSMANICLDGELGRVVGDQVHLHHLHRVPRHAGRHLRHQEVHRVHLLQYGESTRVSLGLRHL